MLANEQRSAERMVYQGTPRGTLHLVLADRRIPVLRIVDISSSGIRLEVDELVDPNVAVSLEYIDAGMRMEVAGTVARFSTLPDELTVESVMPIAGYLLGIALSGPHSLVSAITPADKPT